MFGRANKASEAKLMGSEGIYGIIKRFTMKNISNSADKKRAREEAEECPRFKDEKVSALDSLWSFCVGNLTCKRECQSI